MGTYTTALEKLYVAYFNRPADVRGLAYWDSVVTAQNGSTAAVSAAFAASTEYKATYAGMDNVQIVNKVYNNLFGHDADLPGLMYWADLLDSKAITIDNVVAQIAGGALTTDLDAYNAKVTAASAFTTAMDTTQELLAYDTAAGQAAGKLFLSGVTAANVDATVAAIDTSVASMVSAGTPPPPVNYVNLSTGVDTLAGTVGDDIINAGSDASGNSTLSGLDSINGSTGNNTLNDVDTNAIDTTSLGLTVSNIQTANFTSAGSVKVDSSTWTGLTTLKVLGSIGGDTITAGSGTDVTVLNAIGNNSTTIDGGKSVTYTASGFDGTGGKTITIGGTTAVAGNITATVGVAAAKTAGTVAATTSGGTTVSLTETLGTGSTAGALNVTDKAAKAGAAGTLATVSLDGASGSTVTSNALKTFTLNNSTGAINLTNNYGTGNANTTLALNANNDTATTLTDTAGVYSTINVTTSGKKSTITLVDAGLKTLSVGGSAALTLGTVPATVTAFTGSGSAGVNGTFGAALKTFTSTSSGANTVTLDATKLTGVTMGAGDDTVTFSTALGATATVDVGAGANTVILGAAPTAGASIKAGSGTADTISMTDAIWTTVSAFSSANMAKISGFEVLDINNSGSSNGHTYDLSLNTGFGGMTLETGVATGGNDTITNFVSGQTLTLAGNLATNNGGVIVTVLNASTGTNDTVNVVSNGTITQNNDTTVDTTAITTNLTADNVENVNYKSTGTLSTAVTTGNETDVASNTLVIASTDTKLKNVVFTGDQDVTFVANAAFTALAKIDASALDAAAHINVSAVASSSATVIVTGTANDDTFTLANKAKITGNGGDDTYTVSAPTSGQTYSTIMDANKGDVIAIASLATGSKSALTLESTAVFQDYLDAAAAGTTADHKAYWFSFGGDTYIVQNESTDATFHNGTDIVVKLAGTVDLSAATWAAGSITLG
jgi:S-layer protein